ncbi:MAG: GNAT family N-acyltransferase [Pseudomonadota bacterium]
MNDTLCRYQSEIGNLFIMSNYSPNFQNAEDSGQSQVSGRLGRWETRLAKNSNEVRAAQKLRFDVFRNEFPASTGTINNDAEIDCDAHDDRCDHLLLLDSMWPENNGIIGTQRFMTGNSSNNANAFYSSSEFNLVPLLVRQHEKTFMELGRSCIHPEYRNKRTMELLWHGTWDYALKNQVDVMFGCASFPTIDAQSIHAELEFLHNTNPANGEWDVSAHKGDTIELSSVRSEIDSQRSLLRNLPPLIKGYLRLGARFSKHAVIDFEFGTTDIMVILPVKDINPKYVSYYGATADRHAIQ